MPMMEDNDHRLGMPYTERWSHLDRMPSTGLLFRLNLGSVLGFGELLQTELADRCREALETTGRIAKDSWHWYTGEETVFGDVSPVSRPGSIMKISDTGKLGWAPIDQVKWLYINFASRGDAMLVRMTIMDLRSVKNDHSGGVPKAA